MTTTPNRPPAPQPLADSAAPAAAASDAAVRRLRWAWPVAILVGFPIGGLMANLLVGAIDSITAALAGGLIAGAIIGAAQWLALRSFVPWAWIVATSVGMAAGLATGTAVVDYDIDRRDLALVGAVTGLGVGVLQAFVLATRASRAVWWAVLNPPVWAVAWLITSIVITTNVQERYTNFGAGGALVFAAVTYPLLIFLVRAPTGKLDAPAN